MIGVAGLIATCPHANAQNSMKIYGVLDTAVSVLRGSQGSVTGLTAGNAYPSRLGITGTEDLGGGLKASFTLEAGLKNDVGEGIPTNTNNQSNGLTPGGGLAFNRQSWVGLQSRYGEVRLGRTFTPTYRNYLIYDPFAGGGPFGSQAAFGAIAAGTNPGGIRSSNAIEYWSPPADQGLRVHAMYAMGENTADAGQKRDDGRYRGVRFQYAIGHLNVGAGYARYNLAAVGDLGELTVGAKYDMGSHTAYAMFVKNITGTSGDMDGYLLGYSYRAGAWGFRASFSTSRRTDAAGSNIGSARKLAFSPEYFLSERTRIYAGYARIDNAHGMAATPSIGEAVSVNAPDGTSSFVALGVVHWF